MPLPRSTAVSVLLLLTMGAFLLNAGIATFVPGYVHDRVPNQFVPVWEFFTAPLGGEEPNEAMVLTLARVSQFVIAIAELVAGAALLAAVVLPRWRAGLATFGLGVAICLFGLFMFVTFAIHSPELPKWNQYPAILAWLAVTWIVVALAEAAAASEPKA